MRSHAVHSLDQQVRKSQRKCIFYRIVIFSYGELPIERRLFCMCSGGILRHEGDWAILAELLQYGVQYGTCIKNARRQHEVSDLYATLCHAVFIQG